MKLSNIFNRKNRVLLAELVRTDFKLRYHESALGYLWSVLNPLLLFVILYIVFDKFIGLGRGIEHYPVYLLTGIVLWRFFTEATNNGLRVIVQRGALIRKINFPKYIIVLSGTISALINLLINLGIVLVFALINGVHMSWSALLIVPLIIELYVFALGIAFLLGAVNVKFRDIGYIWEVILQAAFYAVPIIYPLQTIVKSHATIAEVIMLNPVAQVIQDVREVFITRQTITIHELASNVFINAIPFLIVIAAIIIGGLYFRKHQARFAEEI